MWRVTSGARPSLPLAAAVAISLAACLSAQPKPSVPAFDSARAFEDLKKIVEIGPRPAGSAGAEKTREYVRQQLSAAGLTVEEQPFDARTPLGVIRMVNLRAVVPGARSVIVTGTVYNTVPPYADPPAPDVAVISRYAWSDDYHNVLKVRLTYPRTGYVQYRVNERDATKRRWLVAGVAMVVAIASILLVDTIRSLDSMVLVTGLLVGVIFIALRGKASGLKRFYVLGGLAIVLGVRHPPLPGDIGAPS